MAGELPRPLTFRQNVERSAEAARGISEAAVKEYLGQSGFEPSEVEMAATGLIKTVAEFFAEQDDRARIDSYATLESAVGKGVLKRGD